MNQPRGYLELPAPSMLHSDILTQNLKLTDVVPHILTSKPIEFDTGV